MDFLLKCKLLRLGLCNRERGIPRQTTQRSSYSTVTKEQKLRDGLRAAGPSAEVDRSFRSRLHIAHTYLSAFERHSEPSPISAWTHPPISLLCVGSHKQTLTTRMASLMLPTFDGTLGSLFIGLNLTTMYEIFLRQ
jgi:hypothetical protein